MKVHCVAVGPLQVNCYIAVCEEHRIGVVIDPGDDAASIVGLIHKERISIAQILLTHCHADHVGGVKGVADATGAPLRIHEADRFILDGAAEHGRLFGLDIEAPPPPDGYLQEGDVIELGNESLSVLHTPGHSPGGICFLGDAVIFVGDTLFAGSIGRTDLPGGSYRQLINSVSRKILTLDDGILVYPGHGPTTTVGFEKRSNPFFV